MSETPPDEIPDEVPEAGGGESQVDDEPLGVPADGESKTGDLPGIPETEPPSSG